MTLKVDLFWSFRSPYSYLLMPRVMQLVEDFDVQVHMRPVYPLAVRDPAIIKNMHSQFLNYFLLDTQRLADHYGMNLVQPDPDPVDFAAALAGSSSPQPKITRLMRLAAAADTAGRGLQFVDEVSRLIFGGVQNWDTEDCMHGAIARAGLAPEQLEQAVDQDAAALDGWVDANEHDHAAAGHWGVPLLVFAGEPFFGQDRFELLLWRMQQNGLQKRS